MGDTRINCQTSCKVADLIPQAVNIAAARAIPPEDRVDRRPLAKKAPAVPDFGLDDPKDVFSNAHGIPAGEVMLLIIESIFSLGFCWVLGAASQLKRAKDAVNENDAAHWKLQARLLLAQGGKVLRDYLSHGDRGSRACALLAKLAPDVPREQVAPLLLREVDKGDMPPPWLPAYLKSDAARAIANQLTGDSPHGLPDQKAIRAFMWLHGWTPIPELATALLGLDEEQTEEVLRIDQQVPANDLPAVLKLYKKNPAAAKALARMYSDGDVQAKTVFDR